MSVHSFDTDVAAMVGTTAATIAYNIKHWCEKNAANGKHEHDGRNWTYNSVEAFEALFPYLTKSQIRTALSKLEKSGLVLIGDYNKQARDQTKWYSFEPAAVMKTTNCEKSQMQLSKMATPIAKNRRPLPDSKPDNKPSTNVDVASPKIENEIEIAFDGFCTLARKHGWAVPRDLSKTRKAALRKRLKENTLKGWGDVLRRSAASDFLCGRSDRPFTLTIDWLLKPANILKVSEGNYDNRSSNEQQRGGSTVRSKPDSRRSTGFASFADRLEAIENGGHTGDREDFSGGGGFVVDAEPLVATG